ncbi:MAG: recombinase family protein [Candidatus Paceibacterota bacterium]
MEKKQTQQQKICSFGVARVSSDKQAQEGESFDDQRDAIARFAERKGWDNVHTFRFSLSGRTEVSELVKRMTDFLEETPHKIEYCIFKKIDRITRAGTDGYSEIQSALKKYGVEIVDTYEIIQPERNTLEHLGFEYDWSRFSPTGTATLMEINRAKDETRDILTRMIGQEINLVQQGYRVREPNDGYKNETIYVGGKKKCIPVPNPPRSEYYIKMFELREQGNLTDEEIVERINNEGFRSRKRTIWDSDRNPIGKTEGKPLTVKQLQRIILRPVYAGFNCEKWTYGKLVKGNGWDGLVSIETFNRANRGKVFIKETEDGGYELLRDYSPIRQSQKNKNNPLFPHKWVLCDKCSMPFLASAPKGKSGAGFPAYHCGVKNNKSRNHKYYGISKTDFELNVEELLRSLEFNDEYLDVFEKVLINKYREREKEVVKSSSNINRNISDMQNEQANLISQLITIESRVARKSIERKIETIEIDIDKARSERDEMEIKEHDIRSYIRSARYLMEHPEELLIEPDNFEIQRALMGLVFDIMPTYSQITNGTPKLSLTFKLSEQFKRDKNLLVTLQRIEL